MQYRIRVYLLLLMGLSASVRAQTDRKIESFWSLGANVGMIGWSPSFITTTSSTYYHRTLNFGLGELTDNSGKKHFSIIANTSIGVHAGFMWKDRNKRNSTGIYLEFQKNKACYSFQEPFSFGYKGDTSKLWVDADNYLKYSIAIMRTWHFDKDFDVNSCWYGKASFGQTFMHSNFGVVQHLNDKEDWTENGTGMKSNVVAVSPQSYMISLEIGRRLLFDDDETFDIGIVYHAPFVNTRTTEYEFYKSNVPLGPSRVTYAGSTIMLNASYTYNFRIKHKPVDSTSMQAFDQLAVVDSSEIKNYDAVYHHHKVNGRRFNIQQSISMSGDSVTILVWDQNKVDGDEISLYLNEKPILENYTVSKVKKKVVVKLQPGVNVLVMYALNLGRVPPNTAMLNVSDGVHKKNITLVSDLHKSGALEIIYDP